MIAHQVADTTPAPIGADDPVERQLKAGSVAFYAEIASEDALESGLARLYVGLINGGMDAFARAAKLGTGIVARETELKLAIQLTSAARELAKFLDTHRARKRQADSIRRFSIKAGR
jgi:hypothetical protein